jgi:hypothetical protein
LGKFSIDRALIIVLYRMKGERIAFEKLFIDIELQIKADLFHFFDFPSNNVDEKNCEIRRQWMGRKSTTSLFATHYYLKNFYRATT